MSEGQLLKLPRGALPHLRKSDPGLARVRWVDGRDRAPGRELRAARVAAHLRRPARGERAVPRGVAVRAAPMSTTAPAGTPRGRDAASGGLERSSLRGSVIRKLLVVGVGLIGGSCALALKRAGAVGEVVGVGRTRTNLDTALARHVIDRARTLDDDWAVEAKDADVVLLAAPVAQFPALFAALAGHLGPETIVTDAGSTKQDVIAAARAALGGSISHVVPGHPIAGTEHTGAAAAFPSLFEHRNVILTPLPETRAGATERIAALWQTCGARVTTLPPARHDAIFAAVSHLPHVLAFALVAELAFAPVYTRLVTQSAKADDVKADEAPADDARE